MKQKLLLTTLLLAINSASFANSYKAVASLPTYQSQEVNRSTVNKFEEIYGNSTELKIVKYSDTVKTTAARTVLILLAGGSFQGTSKDQLKGSKIEDVISRDKLKNPLFDIGPLTKAYSDEVVNKHKNIKDLDIKSYYIKPTRPYWSLIYDKSDKTIENGYALFFGAEYSKNYLKNCIYQSKAYPLEQWQANDYQLIADEREIIITECANQFKTQTDDLIKRLIDKQNEENLKKDSNENVQ